MLQKKIGMFLRLMPQLVRLSRKYLLGFIAVMVCLGFKAGNKTVSVKLIEDTQYSTGQIPYTSNLTWADFKANVPEGAPYYALTSSLTSYKFSLQGIGDKYTLTFRVKFYFNQNASQKKSSHLSKELLLHEQGHLDISYAQYLLFTDSLKKHQWSISTAESSGKAIFNFFQTKTLELQNDYDKETNHSINAEAQALWAKKIAEMLKAARAKSS